MISMKLSLKRPKPILLTHSPISSALLPLAGMNSSVFSFLSDFVFLLLLFIQIPSSLSNDDLFTACSNQFVCGGISAGFPFWGAGRPPACGIPELELKCKYDITKMNISQVAYRVLEIKPDIEILRIEREDYLVGLCPPQFMNSTFNPKIFEPVEGFKFIYGCKDASTTIPGPTTFTCKINYVNGQSVYIKGENGPGECNGSVFVPVSITDSPPVWNTVALEERLKEGFEVRWKFDRECLECSNSSGVCGFDNVANQTTCYYPGFITKTDMNSFDCGTIRGAGYPFSGSDRPGYCSYPGFELSCRNQDPEITIMRSTYKLHGINSQSRTLNVSRTDYTENLCPTLLSNTSLSPNLSSSNSDHAEVTLYYACPSPIPSGFSAQFTCNINDTDMRGYFIVGNLSDLSGNASSLISYLTTCNNSVIVPARQSAILPILGNPTIGQLLAAINQGFDLVRRANDSLCDTCKSSGGQCGYNQTTTAFTCFCADQPQDFECTASP